MENNKNWFAILVDKEDTDWGTGSFDYDEAVRMAREGGCTVIAEVDGKYDEDGNATADPVCVKEYYVDGKSHFDGKTTKYSAEFRSKEFDLNDLRKQVKNASSRAEIEEVVHGCLLADDSPSVEFSFDTEEDAWRCCHHNYGKDYDFTAFRSNGAVRIAGSMVEQYEEDEDGNWYPGNGCDEFGVFDESVLHEFLKELDVDPDERCIFEVVAVPAIEHSCYNDSYYCDILAKWYSLNVSAASADWNGEYYGFKFDGVEYGLYPVYTSDDEDDIEPDHWELR